MWYRGREHKSHVNSFYDWDISSFERLRRITVQEVGGARWVVMKGSDRGAIH